MSWKPGFVLVVKRFYVVFRDSRNFTVYFTLQKRRDRDILAFRLTRNKGCAYILIQLLPLQFIKLLASVCQRFPRCVVDFGTSDRHTVDVGELFGILGRFTCEG